MLPDPYLTDAEYFEKRRSQLGPNVGKALVQVNMLELVGGVARLTGATDDQTMAAARFRQTFERAQIGGARALDYSAVKVDTSGPSEHAAFEIGEDARHIYRDAVQALGMMRSSLVERVVIYDVPISRIASGARARDRMKRELFDALDVLAVHFRLAAKRAA